MPKGNIWIICKYASPDKYFFGTRHFYLAKEWSKEGYDVTIFTSNSSHLTDRLPKFKGKKKIEYIHKVRAIWLNTIDVKKSNSISRILSWLHFEWQFFTLSKASIPKPDVIIVSSLSILSIISGLFYSKKFKTKFILEIRDIWPLSAIELGKFSKYNFFILFLSFIENLGYKYADYIVGTMPNLKEHIENKLKREVTNCLCIPQGINLEFYHKKTYQKHNINHILPENKFIIAYAGTLNRNNPIDILLQVAKELEAESKLFFLILGDGDQKKRLMDEYDCLTNVKFTGKVEKTQVNAILKNVSLCFDAIDSQIAKFGISRNKWIDYMYAARPIICSYSGFKSMINEAHCGSFVPFGDIEGLKNEILKYMNLPNSEIELIGKNGREFLLKNRTFDKLANDYAKLF